LILKKKTIAKEQIKWEFECLRKVTAILFWFPKETVCPITLYELGAWSILSLKTKTKIFIGCHPEYQRLTDVEVQTSLIRSDIAIHNSLEDLLEDVSDWHNKTNSSEKKSKLKAAL